MRVLLFSFIFALGFCYTGEVLAPYADQKPESVAVLKSDLLPRLSAKTSSKPARPALVSGYVPSEEKPLYERGSTERVRAGLSADGKVMFGRGPVMCTVNDPAVIQANVEQCAYHLGKVQFGGVCQAVLATKREVRAYALVLNLDFKESRPFSEGGSMSFAHTYDKVTCRVESDKLTRLDGCKDYAKGTIRQCVACFKEDSEERCYYAHLSIIKGKQKIARSRK